MKKLLLLVILTPFIYACNQPKYTTIKGEAHGTLYTVIFEGTFDNLTKHEIDSVTKAFDNSLSTYSNNSLISKFNQSEKGLEVDSLFIEMYKTAKTVYENSNKAFDITVAPLVNIYGFGYKQKTQPPDQATIDSILNYVGMDKLYLENNFLHKKHQLTEVDANAVAKGLSVDNLARYMKAKNIKNFLVEIGGEIVASGKKLDRKWIVGIDRPEEGNFTPGKYIQAKVELSDKALATSGNYRRFYEENGKKFVHTINPITGLPQISNLLSVTIIAPDCSTADAYATACMAMGKERAMAMIKKLPNIEAFFISSDQDGNFVSEMTEGMQKFIKN